MHLSYLFGWARKKTMNNDQTTHYLVSLISQMTSRMVLSILISSFPKWCRQVFFSFFPAIFWFCPPMFNCFNFNIILSKTFNNIQFLLDKTSMTTLNLSYFSLWSLISDLYNFTLKYFFTLLLHLHNIFFLTLKKIFI